MLWVIVGFWLIDLWFNFALTCQLGDYCYLLGQFNFGFAILIVFLFVFVWLLDARCLFCLAVCGGFCHLWCLLV